MITILILINISVISANDAEDNNVTLAEDSSNQNIDLSDNILSSPGSEKPDTPDLVDKDYTYVYSSTLDNFFKNGVLDKKFIGKKLAFSGDFVNIGQLEIDCDDVSIIGEDSNLKNTVFKLTGNRITLKNLNFNIDDSIKSNDGATILVGGNDIDLVNLNISYIVPRDVEAYAIYADGYNYGPLENLRIINSSIYFEGHNDNARKYNCAVKLKDDLNAIVENNTIITSLPLKNIEYTQEGTANLDSAYVYSVGIEGCHGLLFNNNTVISDVNKRPAIEYPTLDGIMLSKSDEMIISNNSIYMTDFVTYPGVENYLYGIDIHDLNDLWIVNNSISMITTGGKLALGTAYPIQIAGPVSGVNIEYNDLYSFSNGPNIGIYSQCSSGETYVSIKYNKINVTGLAGTEYWALVTGIESQDTFAEILNNQIEVHSIADVGVNDNIYAISYFQSIEGPNTFDIENNIAITDGFYAVHILGSQYSSIINNTLISYNDKARTGDDAYSLGSWEHRFEDNYDNRVIRAIDYFSSRNVVNNDNVIEISGTAGSNTININSVSGNPQSSDIINNPLIPGYNDLSRISQDIADFSNGEINAGSTQTNSIEFSENQNSQYQEDGDAEVYIENGGNAKASNVDGNNLKAVSNSSSSSSIGVSSNPIRGSQASSSSAGESQSVSKKAYEIEEMMQKEEFIPSIFIIIFAIILLIIGYRRKSEYFE